MQRLASGSPVRRGCRYYGMDQGKVGNGAQYNRQHWLSQGYTLIKGKHEFKFGWTWRRFETLGQDLAGTNGLYQFNRAQTALPDGSDEHRA